MVELVEGRVRRVVAEQLGVDPDELGTDVSLTDNLAADSLDLLELGLTLETEFGVRVRDADLEEVRTYGDLVGMVCTLAAGPASAAAGEGPPAPALVWARIVPAPTAPPGDLQYAGWLTPYTAETIVDDALRSGRGARLELSVSASLTETGLEYVRRQFASLPNRGVEVTVRRDQHLTSPLGPRTRPHEAA